MRVPIKLKDFDEGIGEICKEAKIKGPNLKILKEFSHNIILVHAGHMRDDEIKEPSPRLRRVEERIVARVLSHKIAEHDFVEKIANEILGKGVKVAITT